MIAAISNGAIRAALPAFVSRNAGKQWRNWTTCDQVTIDRRSDAPSILAFDAFVDNPDRRWANPYLLVMHSKLRAIDHELALTFTNSQLHREAAAAMASGCAQLVDDGRAEKYSRGPLAAADGLDFHAVHDTWAGLSHTNLDAIVDALPDSRISGRAAGAIGDPTQRKSETISAPASPN